MARDDVRDSFCCRFRVSFLHTFDEKREMIGVGYFMLVWNSLRVRRTFSVGKSPVREGLGYAMLTFVRSLWSQL